MQATDFSAQAAAHLSSGDAQAFLGLLDAGLRQLPFKPLQGLLASCFLTDPGRSRAFILRCLEALFDADKPARWSSALPYLLLDATPAPTHHDGTNDANPTTQQQAAQLVQQCCATGNIRVGMRVAQLFGTATNDESTTPTSVLSVLRSSLDQQLADGKTGAVIAFAMLSQFPALREGVDVRQLMSQLVEVGKADVVEKGLHLLGRPDQVAFVQLCMEAPDELKVAARAVRTHGLQKEFPTVEKLHRDRMLGRMLDKGLWAAAARYVGSNAAMQRRVIEAMAADDPEHAMALAEQWDMPPSVVGLLTDPATRAAAEAARAAQFLPLALPLDAVHVVADRQALSEARAILAAAEVVGLDVEWRPDGSFTASLLQIATPDHAFLFDLLALLAPPQQPPGADGQGGEGEEAGEDGMEDAAGLPQLQALPLKPSDPQLAAELDVCLKAVLQNPACLKVGVEIASDLRKLARSWPAVSAFSAAGPSLELRDLWTAHLQLTNPVVTKLQRGVGLSSLCQTLLGKPLDKSMQVSDWERRPLLKRQVVYAAQDAHVLLALFQHLMALLPDGQAVVDEKRFFYTSGPPPTAAPRAPSRKLPRPSPARGARANLRATQNDEDGRGGGSGGPGGGSPATAPVAVQRRGSSPATPVPVPGFDGVSAVAAALGSAGLLQALVQLPLNAQSSGPGINTAVAAAHAMAIPASTIAKCLALVVCAPPHARHATPSSAATPLPVNPEASPLLVVLRGHQKVDMHKVARVLGVQRKAVRLATGEECVQLFGHIPGQMPPVGLKHPETTRVLVDAAAVAPAPAVQQQPGCDQLPADGDSVLLHVGAGRPDAVLALTTTQLISLSGGVVVDLALDVASVPSALAHTAVMEANPEQPNMQPPAFLVDSMLGKLCRWLRCLGVDAELAPQQLGQAELIAWARVQGRVLLTRDGGLAARRGAAAAAAYLLASGDPVTQLREVARRWGLTMDERRAMTRCSACNSAEFEVLDPAQAQPLVPERVFQEVHEFFRCSSCSKVFWMGPKSFAALARMEVLLAGVGDPQRGLALTGSEN